MCWAPPESFQASQLSIVPKASSPRSARRRSDASLSSSHASFVPEKYGIEQQAGAARDLGLVAVCLQARAVVGRAPVLPHDRGRDRAPRRAIPQHGRFALVRDADRHDVIGRRARTGKHLGDGRSLRGPDFLGVVLDPAGAREVLRELALRRRDDVAVVVEQDRSGTCRALVQGEHESAHAADLQRSCKPTTSRRSPTRPADGRASQASRCASLPEGRCRASLLRRYRMSSAVTAHSSRRR